MTGDFLALFENFRGRTIVKFGKATIKSRHGIETVFKNQFRKIWIILLFGRRNQIADSYHINIVIQVFSDIRIEQARKIIFIISEHG